MPRSPFQACIATRTTVRPSLPDPGAAPRQRTWRNRARSGSPPTDRYGETSVWKPDLVAGSRSRACGRSWVIRSNISTNWACTAGSETQYRSFHCFSAL